MLKYQQFILEENEEGYMQGVDKFNREISDVKRDKQNLIDSFDRFTKNPNNLNFIKSFVSKSDDKKGPIPDETALMNQDPMELGGRPGPQGKVNKELISKFGDYVKYKEEADYLRKEPKYVNQFFTFKEKESKTDQELKDLFKNIQQHRNTLKQQQIEISNVDTYEEVSDILLKMELIEKTNKFLKLIPNKDELRTKIRNSTEWMELFAELLIGYSYEDYKNTFLRKVAKYHTPQDFFDALENHISSFAPRSALFQSVEEHPGAEVVMSTEDHLIARIYSKKASCDLGSQQWCIAGKHGSYWNQYIVGGNYDTDKYPGVQYIVWDFNYKPTKQEYQTGITMYRSSGSRGRDYVAHLKNDNSTNIENKEWKKYLINFDDLSLVQKVRLIAENPEVEKAVKIINGLTEAHKRKLLEQIPVLLKQFDDLTFLSNEEIWNLVKKDISLTEFLPVAKQLTDDQKLISIIKNPDLLDMNFGKDGKGDKENKVKNNPYTKVTHMLTRSQRIEMISNKHSLYPSFDLTEDELFELIDKNVNILISYPKIAQKVDQLRLKKEYIRNKAKWDNKMNQSNDDSKHRVALMLTHLIKSDSRLKMESQSSCYIFIGKEINGKIVPENEYGLIQIDNVLEPENERIAIPLLMVGFSDELKGYSGWISKGLIDQSDLVEYMYKFKGDIEKLSQGIGDKNDKNEIEILNSIQFDSIPPVKIIKR